MVSKGTSTIVPLLINGESITTATTFPVHNPNTGKELWSCSSATAKEANAAANAAHAAFPIWSAMTYMERRDLLLKAADAMAAMLDEIKQADMDETAAEEAWADFDSNEAVNILREVASRCSSIVGELPPVRDPSATALVYKVPYGVVLGIAPWNAAALLSVRSIAYPLAGGNTVVLKSSELSAKTHYLVGEAFRRAGFPPGVVNVVAHAPSMGPEVIGALIKHQAVRKINFTGSTTVGRILAQQAAKELKPILLELGGKAPMVVLESADLKAASYGAAFGSNFHAGQVCMATERVVVVENVAAEFEKALRESYAELYPEAFRPQPAVQVAGAKKVKVLLEDALSKGAEVVFGSADYGDEEGRSISPTLLKNVEKTDLFYAESFGPVVSLVVVPTVEEAIQVANDTEYGLSASVWGELAAALKVAKQLQSGAVHINEGTIHDEATLPHGGMGWSGFGRFGGSWGISEFMTTKTIRFKV